MSYEGQNLQSNVATSKLFTGGNKDVFIKIEVNLGLLEQFVNVT